MDEYSAAVSKRTCSMSVIKASQVMSFRDSALFLWDLFWTYDYSLFGKTVLWVTGGGTYTTTGH